METQLVVHVVKRPNGAIVAIFLYQSDAERFINTWKRQKFLREETRILGSDLTRVWIESLRGSGGI